MITRIFRQAALVVAILLVVCSSWASETFHGKVVGVSDGDTITVLHDQTQIRVRLYGINTPERRQALTINNYLVPCDMGKIETHPQGSKFVE